MARYAYSITNDTVNGVLNSTELHKEIVASALPNFIGIIDDDVTDDIFEIEFSTDLDTGQQATLTGVVNTHTAVSTDSPRTCENCANFVAIT